MPFPSLRVQYRQRGNTVRVRDHLYSSAHLHDLPCPTILQKYVVGMDVYRQSMDRRLSHLLAVRAEKRTGT